jgi:hypothetical protein
MNIFKYDLLASTFFLIVFLSACDQDTQWKGQEPVKKVDTHTVPIQKQFIGTFDLGKGIYTSNDFDGARLNGIVLTNDTLITALITPENTPINGSPWYAFKIWSDTEKKVRLKLTYLAGVKHRYYPKLSYDGQNWIRLDSANYYEETTIDSSNKRGLPDFVSMNLLIGPDTLWVAAQELITSKHVYSWINKMDSLSFISSTSIGESREGRPIKMLRIGNSDDKKMILVMSRQHPPEVTGYLAMKAFVETISSDNETARRFREKYNTYVIPLVNPDGVDNGHWRHNAGGVDLNRDWNEFNQPETAVVKRFIENKISTTRGKFYFAVDFHSTFEDIYYTINPELKGNMPGLVPNMIESMGRELSDYEPNIRPGLSGDLIITSTDYFFHELNAESLTYEIGDNTPRDFLKRKGEVSAMNLMELMIK